MKLKTLLLVSTTLIGIPLLSNSFQLAKAVAGAEENSLLEIAASQALLTVDIVVIKDALKGWNLQTKIKNFRFALENANTQNNPGESDAHIYLNGKKLARLYSS